MSKPESKPEIIADFRDKLLYENGDLIKLIADLNASIPNEIEEVFLTTLFYCEAADDVKNFNKFIEALKIYIPDQNQQIEFFRKWATENLYYINHLKKLPSNLFGSFLNAVPEIQKFIVILAHSNPALRASVKNSLSKNDPKLINNIFTIAEGKDVLAELLFKSALVGKKIQFQNNILANTIFDNKKSIDELNDFCARILLFAGQQKLNIKVADLVQNLLDELFKKLPALDDITKYQNILNAYKALLEPITKEDKITQFLEKKIKNLSLPIQKLETLILEGPAEKLKNELREILQNGDKISIEIYRNNKTMASEVFLDLLFEYVESNNKSNFQSFSALIITNKNFSEDFKINLFTQLLIKKISDLKNDQVGLIVQTLNEFDSIKIVVSALKMAWNNHKNNFERILKVTQENDLIKIITYLINQKDNNDSLIDGIIDQSKDKKKDKKKFVEALLLNIFKTTDVSVVSSKFIVSNLIFRLSFLYPSSGDAANNFVELVNEVEKTNHGNAAFFKKFLIDQTIVTKGKFVNEAEINEVEIYNRFAQSFNDLLPYKSDNIKKWVEVILAENLAIGAVVIAQELGKMVIKINPKSEAEQENLQDFIKIIYQQKSPNDLREEMVIGIFITVYRMLESQDHCAFFNAAIKNSISNANNFLITMFGFRAGKGGLSKYAMETLVQNIFNKPDTVLSKKIFVVAKMAQEQHRGTQNGSQLLDLVSVLANQIKDPSEKIIFFKDILKLSNGNPELHQTFISSSKEILGHAAEQTNLADLEQLSKILISLASSGVIATNKANEVFVSLLSKDYQNSAQQKNVVETVLSAHPSIIQTIICGQSLNFVTLQNHSAEKIANLANVMVECLFPDKSQSQDAITFKKKIFACAEGIQKSASPNFTAAKRLCGVDPSLMPVPSSGSVVSPVVKPKSRG